jgi:hypothetical protein
MSLLCFPPADLAVVASDVTDGASESLGRDVQPLEEDRVDSGYLRAACGVNRSCREVCTMKRTVMGSLVVLMVCTTVCMGFAEGELAGMWSTTGMNCYGAVGVSVLTP